MISLSLQLIHWKTSNDEETIKLRPTALILHYKYWGTGYGVKAIY